MSAPLAAALLCLLAALLLPVGTGPGRRGPAGPAERAGPAEQPARGAEDVSEAPDPGVVLELVATALRAGMSLPGAVSAVGRELPGAAGETLRGAGDLLAAGLDPDAAFAAAGPVYEDLRAACVLAARSGTDIAQLLTEASADLRRARSRAAETEASRLAVRLVLPAGVCLLPAFVLLGIVPTVVSLLRLMGW